MTATLCGPGGVRTVIAENLLLKQQLIVVRRPRQRAPRLTASDRLLFGFGSLFLSPGRIRKVAIGVRLSVSNSLSGRHWELDQGPAVGNRTDIVQLGTGHHGHWPFNDALRSSARATMCRPAKGNGVWPFNDAWLRTSLEEARRQAPRNGASILDSARELGIRDAQAAAPALGRPG